MHGLVLLISEKELDLVEALSRMNPFNYDYEEKQVFQPLSAVDLEDQKNQYEKGKVSVSSENKPFIDATWKELYPTFEEFMQSRFEYDEEDKVFGITCNPDYKFTAVIPGGRWAPFPIKKPEGTTDLIICHQSPTKHIDIELMLDIINKHNAAEDNLEAKKAYEETVMEFANKSKHHFFYMPDAMVKNGKWIDLPEDDRSWEKVFSMIDDEDWVIVMDYKY